MANAKSNSPKPFLATITPSSIDKGTASNNTRYTVMKGANVQRGRDSKTRTVVAFGQANRAIARSIKVGKPIDLMCVWDGGSVRVVGRPEKKAA